MILLVSRLNTEFMMLLKSWCVKASRVMPLRMEMVAANSIKALLPGVLRHQQDMLTLVKMGVNE